MPPYRVDRPLRELQQAFVDLRFGMFVHFNLATFQNREWGDPDEEADDFDPSHLDCGQWADAAVSAGMKYACITAKHHDGFCLWPTATDSASVKQTPRKIDVFRAFVDAFRERGIKVGFHFSILDLRQNIRRFDVTPAKIRLIKDQLTELLSHYGEMDIVIFDGWDAPWSRISYQEVPFHEIYGHVKQLQPNCLVSDLNAGRYPASALYYSDIKAFEQNAGQHVPGDNAIPAQSCVTLTDGWFWKRGDEGRTLKSVHQVVDEWLRPQNSISCNLILNAPPTPEGILAPNVVLRLKEIGAAWKNPGPAAPLGEPRVLTTPNLATGQPIYASSCADTIGPDEANDGSFGSSWEPDAGRTEGWLEVRFKRPASFNALSLVEPVGSSDEYGSSRISSYRFQAWTGSSWSDLASGESPDRVQLCGVPRCATSRLRLMLTGREGFRVADLGVYDEPGAVHWK